MVSSTRIVEAFSERTWNWIEFNFSNSISSERSFSGWAERRKWLQKCWSERRIGLVHDRFLGGLFYTENCYECKYAQLNRVSDITIGDSWGSELPTEEQKKMNFTCLVPNKKRWTDSKSVKCWIADSWFESSTAT